MAEIKNPNQGKGGTSNTSFLVMMVVMLGVFAGLQFYRSKQKQPLQPPTAQTQSQQSAPISAPTGSKASFNANAVKAPAASAAADAIAASAEQTTTIENELYKITFSNRGAEVRSWILKKFKSRYGGPLDLVNAAASKEYGFPLSLYTYDAGMTRGLRTALFVPSVTGNLTSPQTLTFRYHQGNVDVTKTFHFDSTYVVKAESTVKVDDAPVRALLSWPAGFGDQEQVGDYNSSRINTMRNGKSEGLEFKKVTGGETLNAPLQYAATDDAYFVAAFLPDNPGSATAVTLHNTIDVNKLMKDGKVSGKPVDVPVVGVALGDTDGTTSTRVYVGPKSAEVLKAIPVSGSSDTLEPLLDFGFWGPIAKFLFWFLNWIHDHIASNWGWAIVALTVVVNLVLLPFRFQSLKSGLKMQRIQPQMDAIKAKYAKYKVTDPKRADMNAEIMALQKDNGVNMLGGCVPTLLTFPLLFAMLGMLPKVVELREAHWFWLHDLTAADPYHILPIVMVLSQFLTQFYMPAPGMDPQQQKMMAFMMPVFSGFITWNYSSGLALYWCVGNLMMVAAQLAMNQTKEGREMRELAAKRARRKVGSPQAKTIQGKR
ncbi:membrane protein insertase, YidC/Oxa1 family, N-terminal domain protein [Terriglobus roseus DSM 18391]|uniref:Membrane protein insertase YidC n=1 Tax=Terriglobus roseus (strain DSM 18391 / NRRL B-41598 / KBS 63) TaxID=926566 RepID=I3ZMQ5_TERRK|nr:membrane protein insertase YidC [Terriglobus roseus]AFL90523.1 membrane protein insertase, YidC/Oxa1 family, N-terminal domain protein [Terriglobus roseus DSM 18391]